MAPTLYERLGGEKGLRELVRRFYQLMDALPETKGIRAMHPAALESSEEKLFLFLSGWTGGPQLFVEKHGHPMLRRRHFPFAIGERERDQWMLCMERAMRDTGVPDDLFDPLREAFFRLADHLRNQEPST